MTARTKRVIWFIVLAFVLYAVIAKPQVAASYVQDAFVFLADAVHSVFTFFSSLLQ
jgi:divalent metal cation (Fe/Co/Zn/Cd) transporter